MLVYCGSPGIGKTYFCAALAEWVLTRFNTKRYWKEENLLKKLREDIGNGFGDYAQMLEFYTDDELIILDDVGSGIDAKKYGEKNYDWRCEVFYTFIDYRYRNMLPTIITSNFSRQDFKKIYADRTTSRLFDKDNTIIELMDGFDKRSET